VARGGKGGHTPHRQPSRPHAGDRRLGSVSNPRFRAAVKAAKTPITREEFSSLLGIVSGLKFGRVTGMAKGGAAPTGRATGAGTPRKVVPNLRAGKVAGSADRIKTKIEKRLLKGAPSSERFFQEKVQKRISAGGPFRALSPKRREQLKRTLKRVEQIRKEFK